MPQKIVFITTISLVGIALLIALGGCRPKTLTVSEVRQDAPELDGSQIRVRGWADVYTEPYVGFIGCAPAGVIENDVVVGRMFLLPENEPPQQSAGLAIAETSLLCEGSHCGLSCAPFDPGNMAYCWAVRGYSTPRYITYELVGTLRVSQTNGEPNLVLADIKLSKSQRLIAGTWEPIPTGTVGYACP